MYDPVIPHPLESLLFDLLNWAYEDLENFINVKKMLSKEDCDLTV